MRNAAAGGFGCAWSVAAATATATGAHALAWSVRNQALGGYGTAWSTIGTAFGSFSTGWSVLGDKPPSTLGGGGRRGVARQVEFDDLPVDADSAALTQQVIAQMLAAIVACGVLDE